MMTKPRLDLDAIQAFVLVAELNSFTRAAEVIGTTQAGVSMKLKRLEAQLGRRLLERTPRHVRLSAEGETFLVPARELLDAHESAIAAFDIQQRRISIGISQLLVGARLPALLQQLVRHDAHLVVDIRVAGSRDLYRALEANELDAVIALHDPQRKGGRVICMEHFLWMAAPNWRPSANKPLPLSTQGANCSIRQATVRELDLAGIPWTEVFIGQGAACVGAAASVGLALAVLARRAAPADTVDAGARLGLPELPTRKVMLHSPLRDRRSRAALEILEDAFKQG